MGTITAQNIFDRVGLIVNENTPVRWLAAEMLKWLNDGQRVICVLKHDACSITEAIKQVRGTKQTLPSGSFQLLDIPRNMGTAGTSPGNAVRLIERRILDDEIPNWHGDTESDITERYVYEPEISPKVYYIYPPSTGNNYLEICHVKTPTDLVNTTDAISLDDIYEPALLAYILFRIFSKDADFVINASRAQQYFSEFLMLIGRMDIIEASKNPNLQEMEKVRKTMEQATGAM